MISFEIVTTFICFVAFVLQVVSAFYMDEKDRAYNTYSSSSNTVTTNSNTKQINITNEIAELAKFREAGLLTEEQYRAAVDKILKK